MRLPNEPPMAFVSSRRRRRGSHRWASTGAPWSLSRLVMHAYLLASRASDSLVTARRALTLARERGERLHEAHALWLVGEAFAQASSPNELSSERSYREALTLATELNMRPLAAHCHLGLGKLHGRTGDCVKGEEHLNTAMMMVPRDGYALLAAA